MASTVRSILAVKGRTVYSIEPTASVFDALRLMAEANVGALVVVENDKLVGIISERDYARKVALLGRSSPSTQVRDIMSTRVLCARPEQTVQDCLGLMTARAVRHLPVLDRKDLVGIVSIGDLVKAIIGEQQFVIEQLENYIHGNA
jgi:CBS domain-containing protein